MGTAVFLARAVAVTCLLLGGAVASATSAAPASDDTAAGFAYLAGFANDPGLAPYLVEAAVANGLDPHTWPAKNPVWDALAVAVANESFQALLRPLHAMAVAQAAPQGLVEAVLEGFREGQFGNPQLLNDDAWAILALHAAGIDDPRLAQAALGLAQAQHASGGWGWLVGGAADVDSTGMAMEALAAVGHLDAESAMRAANWLASLAGADGGYPATAGEAANCDSTAWAIRGLWAAGKPHPEAAAQFLSSLRRPDGAFAFQPGQPANALCTAEALTVIGLAATRGGWLGPPAAPRGTPWVALAPGAFAVLVGAAAFRRSTFRVNEARPVGLAVAGHIGWCRRASSRRDAKPAPPPGSQAQRESR